MRKVLYVHDLPFFKDGSSWCSASFTDEYFYRFLDAGYDQVDIVSRVSEMDSTAERYNRLRGDLIKIQGLVGASYKRLFYPSVVTRLFCFVKSSDLVVVSTPSVIGFFVSFLCIVLRRKYVCEVAGDYTAFQTKRMGGAITWVLRIYMPWLIKKASGATYVTNDLAEKYPNPVFLIGSNVNIYKINPKLDFALRKEDEVNIGFVGGLVARKGIETMIRAAYLLNNKGCGKRYLFNFVGGHADREWRSICLEMGVSDICIFHGMRNRSEIDALLADFDIYIQPSLSEGVPRATIEAMSHGLPIIATTLPGFYEILPQDVLIMPGDADALADFIYSFSQDHEVRKAHGERNLNRAKDFLFEEMNEKRARFYKKYID